jgi:hypothetical protein
MLELQTPYGCWRSWQPVDEGMMGDDAARVAEDLKRPSTRTICPDDEPLILATLETFGFLGPLFIIFFAMCSPCSHAGPVPSPREELDWRTASR